VEELRRTFGRRIFLLRINSTRTFVANCCWRYGVD